MSSLLATLTCKLPINNDTFGSYFNVKVVPLAELQIIGKSSFSGFILNVLNNRGSTEHFPFTACFKYIFKCNVFLLSLFLKYTCEWGAQQ